MGYFAVIVAALLASSKDLVSKRLAADVDGLTSTFASFAFALPFYAVLLLIFWLAGVEDFVTGESFLLLVILRSLSDVGAELCKMTAFRYGDLSVVTCFFSLSPIFLVILSPLITGDPVSSRELLALGIVTVGSIVVAYRPRRSTDGVQWQAILLSLASAFFFAVNTCFDRLAVQSSSAVFAGAAMTMFSGGVLMPVALVSRSRIEALYRHRRAFSLRGGIEVVFMVLKLVALQFLTAPIVVSLQRLAIVFSIINGRLVLREQHAGQRLVGGTIILIGVMIAVL